MSIVNWSPHVLKHFNLFVDGRGYAGIVEELVPPKLTIKTEEYRGGGMDCPIPLDMGMEKMEAEVTMAEYDIMTLKLFGFQLGGAIAMTFRGVLKAAANPIPVPIAVNLRGFITEIDMGTWKAGEKSQYKFKMGCTYYKLSMGEVPIIEIDPENYVRFVGGEDQLIALRAAIGRI